MVIMTALTTIRAGKETEFFQTIFSLRSVNRMTKGFRKLTLYQDIDDPSRFRLIQEWETQADLESYIDGDQFKVLLGALKVLCEDWKIQNSREIKKSTLFYPGEGVDRL